MDASELETRRAACPYCPSKDGFVTKGMQVHKISRDDLMELLNTGWRRFGGYLWKPDETMCCKQMPIRVNVHDLILNADKKKVWKNIEKYCRKGNKPQEQKKKHTRPRRREGSATHHHEEGHHSHEEGHHAHEGEKRVSRRLCPRKHDMEKVMLGDIPEGVYERGLDKCSLCMQSGVLSDPKGYFYWCRECEFATHSSEGCSWHKIPRCPMGHKMKHSTEPNPRPCDVCRDTDAPNADHCFCAECDIRMHVSCRWPRVPPCHSCGSAMQYYRSGAGMPATYKSPSCDACSKGKLQDDPKGYYHCSRCNTDTHRDGCRVEDFSRHIIGSIEEGMCWVYEGVKVLEVEVRKPKDTEEKYQLFRKYQKIVHGDERLSVLTIGTKGDDELGDRDLYRKYLVDSPLEGGTFHFEYYLDEKDGTGKKLFMVTVADLVPNCINSVYCFYDPDLKKLAPGKFSVLFEIAWMKKQHINTAAFDYYYLGMFFKHKKMIYKAEYKPSEVLLPSGEWVLLENLLEDHPGSVS